MVFSNKAKHLVFIVLALTTINCDEINFKKCDTTTEGTVTSISVGGCDTSMSRCILKRNTNASLEITFQSGKDASELQVVVHGIVLDVPVPFSIDNPNGCKDSNIECPIKSGSTYVYKNLLPVLKKYPKVTVDVKWEIKSGNDTIMCAIIPAKIS